MAEVVDGLIIESTFDDEGLSESEQAQIQAVRELVAAINQQANQLEPFELDVTQVAAALESLGVDTKQFFAAYVAGAAQAVDAAELVASATRAIPPPAPPTTPPNADPPGPPPDLLARFRAFYDTLGELARASQQTQAAELRRFADEAADVLDLPALNSEESVRELLQLEAAFAPLAARLQQFDPAGNLQRMAVAAHGAVIEMRQLAEATTGATVAQERLAAVPPVAAGGGGLPPNDPPKGPTPDQIAQAERHAEALRDETAALIALATATDHAATAIQGFQAAQAARVSSAEALAGAQARQVAATEQLSAVEAQQAIHAARSGAAAQQSAQQTAQASQQAAGAMRLKAAAAEEAAQSIDALTASERANIATTERVTAAFNEAGRQARVLSRDVRERVQGSEAWARGVANIDAANKAAAGSSLLAIRGFGRIQNSLVGLASAAAGVPGPIGNIAGALLQVAVGGGVVAAVAAGVGVLIVAYRELTRETRESQQATEAFVQSQVKAAGTRDPYAEMIRQLEGVPGKIEGITAAQIRLNRELAAQLDLQARNREGGNAGFFTTAIENTRRQLADIETALQEGAKQRADTIFREVATAMAAQRQAQEQAVSDDLALQRTGFQARESALRSAFAREQVTAEAFYAERIQIAREAGQAEIDALEASRDALDRAVPGEKPEAVTGRAEQVAHLNRLIALRRAELDLAVQQVREEAALTALQRQRALLASLAVEPPETLAIPVDLDVRTDVADIAKGLVDSAGLEVAAREAKAAQDQVNRLNTRLSITTGILERIGEGAENLGLISEESKRAIVSVLGLVDSLGQLKVANEAIKQADAAGDAAGSLAASVQQFSAIGQIIGAGIGILSTFAELFGGESEHDRVLRENTAALAQLTAGLNTQFEGLGGAEQLRQGILTALANTPRETGSKLPGVVFNIEGFLEQLDALGISIEDVERIAQQVIPGLELFDANGRLVAESLDILNQAILATAKAELQFRDNVFQDQLQALDLRSRLAGIEQTAEEALRQQIQAAANVGATGITQFFAGVDLANREAVRAAAQALLEAFDAGLLDPATLGGLSRDDIIAIISGAADQVEALGDAAEEATKSMLNIPTGFKLNQLIFENADVGPPPVPPRVPNIPIPAEIPTPTFDPRQLPQVPVEVMSAAVTDSIPALAADDYLATIRATIPAVPLERFLALLSEKLPVIDPTRRPGSDGAQQPGFGAGVVNVTFAAGSIVQQPGEDSLAFAQRVSRAIRDLSYLQTADTQAMGPI